MASFSAPYGSVTMRTMTIINPACPICMELKTDMMQTLCGHSFCLSCINKHCVFTMDSDETGAPSGKSCCPVCRMSSDESRQKEADAMTSSPLAFFPNHFNNRVAAEFLEAGIDIDARQDELLADPIASELKRLQIENVTLRSQADVLEKKAALMETQAMQYKEAAYIAGRTLFGFHEALGGIAGTLESVGHPNTSLSNNHCAPREIAACSLDAAMVLQQTHKDLVFNTRNDWQEQHACTPPRLHKKPKPHRRQTVSFADRPPPEAQAPPSSSMDAPPATPVPYNSTPVPYEQESPRYVPTSPSYSPTSPSYSPTSPSYSPTSPAEDDPGDETEEEDRLFGP